MNAILGLLEDMEAYFEECKNIPFSNKVVVNMEIIYEFMTDLRMKLPEEIKKAHRVLEDKDKIIADAQEMANKAAIETEKRVSQLVDEHEIKQHALKEAEQIIKNAQETAYQLKSGAHLYVDEVLAQLENVIKETVIQTNTHYSNFEDYVHKQLEILGDNRTEIQKKK